DEPARRFRGLFDVGRRELSVAAQGHGGSGAGVLRTNGFDRRRGLRKRRGDGRSRKKEHGGGAREGRAPEEGVHSRSSSTDRSALRTSFSLTVDSGSLTSCAKMTVSA